MQLQVSRQSIDVVKDYFREEMSKADWQLMVEMKKIFEILWTAIPFIITSSI